MQPLTHMLAILTLYEPTADEGLQVLQLGPEGVNLATMQGLQPHLQASGSQGLPGSLLHGHPSLQGELHLSSCIHLSSVPSFSFLPGFWLQWYQPNPHEAVPEDLSALRARGVPSHARMVRRCSRRGRRCAGPANAAAAVHLTTPPSLHAAKGEACPPAACSISLGNGHPHQAMYPEVMRPHKFLLCHGAMSAPTPSREKAALQGAMENLASSRFANQGAPLPPHLADMADPAMHMPPLPWGR